MNESVRAEQALSYTLSVLLPDGPPAAGGVRYGPPGQRRPDGPPEVCIVPSGFFGSPYMTADSLPQPPLKEVDGVPLLFGRPEIERRRGQLIVHADVVASTFFLVTRYEEVVRRGVRDRHGRFPGVESLPVRAGFIDRPVVDEYARLLRGWLQEAGVQAPAPARSFSVALTHDADWVRKYPYRFRLLRTGLSALLGLQPRENFGEVLRMAAGRQGDPYDTFDELVRLDAGLGGRSIYFFIAGGRSEADRMYDIRGRHARRTLAEVGDSGAAVGLHVSYDAGRNPNLIASERAALEAVVGRPVSRSRHHFLAWREVGDGHALARAGITDDYTLGYADAAGFRLGVCRPIPLFDPVAMQPMGLIEHPLIAMDASFSTPEYMAMDEEQAFEYCSRLIDRTREHDGEFVALWHNTSLAPGPGNYHPRLYRRILEALAGVGD